MKAQWQEEAVSNVDSDERPACVLLLFDPERYFPELRGELEKRFRVVVKEGISLREDAVEIINEEEAEMVEAVVGKVASERLLEKLPKLRIIACVSTGVERIDVAACHRHGIAVSGVPSISKEDVADLAILFMLAASRRIGCAPKATRRHVGIIGLGDIGTCIARRAVSFNCSISYYGKSGAKANVPFRYYHTVVELARDCDVLFIACALTNETMHMVNKSVLDALGPQGILVNIARGPIVKEVDLIAALREGRLGFAALDVFDNEPWINKELTSMHNVLLTPHIGSATKETRGDIVRLVVANLEAFFAGKPLVTPLS